jgi:integrase/recombinase XerD
VKPSDLLQDFLTYMKSKKKSNNTIKGYNSDLTKFIEYITTKNLPITEIKLKHLENYLATIDAKESSMNRYISSIQSFFKYLHKMDIIDNNPSTDLERPEIPKRNPKVLNLQESKNAIKNVEKIDGKYKERDIAIMTLFLNLGLRVSELRGIDITDIKENSIRLIRKGNEEQVLPLNQACITAINNYLTVRPEIEGKDSNALFISRNKQRMTIQAIEDITKKYAGINPHSLRHSMACNLLGTGKVNLRQIQELLNHKNISTTQIYTHITGKEMMDAVNANPLND